MPVNLASCTFAITGAATLHDVSDPVTTPTQTAQVGGGFSTIALALEDGDGDGEANQMFAERVTVPGSSAIDFDLSDGSLANFRGEPITFEKIKLVLLAVVDPDGTKRVYAGPQGAPGGAQLWFLGTGADAADEVLYGQVKANLKDGWGASVTGGSVLRLYNPDATNDVEVDVVVIGVDG